MYYKKVLINYEIYDYEIYILIFYFIAITLMLTKRNIVQHNGGYSIVYKHHKTKEEKKVKPIRVNITDAIKEL